MIYRSYAEDGRELTIWELPNGQFAATAWDPHSGEMFLPRHPMPPMDRPEEAQAALDAYAEKHSLLRWEM